MQMDQTMFSPTVILTERVFVFKKLHYFIYKENTYFIIIFAILFAINCGVLINFTL